MQYTFAVARGLSQRGQFIAWVLLYGGAVWLVMSKGDESLSNLAWGMLLGVGAATATAGPALHPWPKRLTFIAVWFGACWLLGLALFWPEHARRSSALVDILQSSALVTALAGFPALLALAVWLFKRPKAASNA